MNMCGNPQLILFRFSLMTFLCFAPLSQAAWYPDDPSDDEKMKIKNFFDALARFYPCTYCADDFSKNLRKNPVA